MPRFRARAAADLEQLIMLWADDPASPDFRRLIHSLAGAAGMFGFTNLSIAAMAVDERHASGSQADGVQMDRLFQCLRQAAEG